MKFIKLLDICLSLFDGDGSGAGAQAAGQTGSGASGESTAAPGNTRRGKSGDSSVLYGKQANAAEEPGRDKGKDSDAGREEKQGVTVTSNTLEDRRKAFLDLVNGEYKDVYTEETQRIIDRRFRETKNLEQQVGRYQPVVDMLMQRYKIGDGDVAKLAAAIENDDAYWSEAAEEAGMSVDQYKQFQKLQRENEALRQAQLQQQGQQAAREKLNQWMEEGESLKAVYPDFDLGAESRNPQFLSMLKAGVPVRHAYEVIHMDEIKAGVAQNTAKQTEKQVVDGIRARGARPVENGTLSQSAFTVKDDPGKWSKKDRAEVARRVARGETITL